MNRKNLYGASLSPSACAAAFPLTSIESALAIVQSKAVRLSEFSRTNNASEYLYAKSQFIRAYQGRKVWIEEIPRYLVNMVLHSHECATTMMIASLAEERDDIGLWDRYGQSGAGCVLGIDATWLAERGGVALRRVSHYQEHLFDYVQAGLELLQSHCETNKSDRAALVNLARRLVSDLYAFKDPRVRSECEIRASRLTVADENAETGLVDPGGTSSDGSTTPSLPILVRDGMYGATRFLELPLWDTSGKVAIRSVGLGPRIAARQVEQVADAVSTLRDVDLWKSNAPL